jgi:hypothetical protein
LTVILFDYLQDFKPRIHISESDYAVLTKGWALCDEDGNLGPEQFEAALRNQMKLFTQRQLSNALILGTSSRAELVQLGTLKVVLREQAKLHDDQRLRDEADAATSNRLEAMHCDLAGLQMELRELIGYVRGDKPSKESVATNPPMSSINFTGHIRDSEFTGFKEEAACPNDFDSLVVSLSPRTIKFTESDSNVADISSAVVNRQGAMSDFSYSSGRVPLIQTQLEQDTLLYVKHDINGQPSLDYSAGIRSKAQICEAFGCQTPDDDNDDDNDDNDQNSSPLEKSNNRCQKDKNPQFLKLPVALPPFSENEKKSGSVSCEVAMRHDENIIVNEGDVDLQVHSKSSIGSTSNIDYSISEKKAGENYALTDFSQKPLPVGLFVKNGPASDFDLLGQPQTESPGAKTNLQGILGKSRIVKSASEIQWSQRINSQSAQDSYSVLPQAKVFPLNRQEQKTMLAMSKSESSDVGLPGPAKTSQQPRLGSNFENIFNFDSKGTMSNFTI